MCPGSKAPRPLRRAGRFFHLSGSLARMTTPPSHEPACLERGSPDRISTLDHVRHAAMTNRGTPPRGALKLQSPDRTRGVTLVELMTTLAILTIVSTFGMTAFADAIARHRVQTALHLISADLAMARNTAITRRSHVIACPGDPSMGCRLDANWSHGWIVFADPDGNHRPDSEIDLLRVGSAPPGAPHSIRLTATRNFVRYQRDGRSAGTNLTVNICHKETLAGQVVVNNLGRVRSSRPQRAADCPT